MLGRVNVCASNILRWIVVGPMYSYIIMPYRILSFCKLTLVTYTHTRHTFIEWRVARDSTYQRPTHTGRCSSFYLSTRMASMNSDDDGELCLSHTPSHQPTQRTLYDEPTVWRKGVSECGKFGMCARVSAFRIQRQWESAWKLKGNAISLFTPNNSDKTVSPFEFARHSMKSHFRFFGRPGAEEGRTIAETMIN